MHSALPDRPEYPEQPVDRAWDDLPTVADVERWIIEHDLELRQYVTSTYPSGQGICFTLAEGGEIYLHTNGEGDILLDVTADAQWVTPLISAATGQSAPAGQTWLLPGDVLTQLVLGLNSLIGSSRIVLSHRFSMKR